MLLTNLSSAPIYKTLKVCKITKSVRLGGHFFGMFEQYNFEKLDVDMTNKPINIRSVFINLDKHIDISEIDFSEYFSTI